jgi:hypothetical protein
VGYFLIPIFQMCESYKSVIELCNDPTYRYNNLLLPEIIYKENRKKLKDMYKQQYLGATDEDFQSGDGRTNKMLERLKQQLGKTAEDLDDIILEMS